LLAPNIFDAVGPAPLDAPPGMPTFDRAYEIIEREQGTQGVRLLEIPFMSLSTYLIVERRQKKFHF
jgi:hypothetical protein